MPEGFTADKDQSHNMRECLHSHSAPRTQEDRTFLRRCWAGAHAHPKMLTVPRHEVIISTHQAGYCRKSRKWQGLAGMRGRGPQAPLGACEMDRKQHGGPSTSSPPDHDVTQQFYFGEQTQHPRHRQICTPTSPKRSPQAKTWEQPEGLRTEDGHTACSPSALDLTCLEGEGTLPPTPGRT